MNVTPVVDETAMADYASRARAQMKLEQSGLRARAAVQYAWAFSIALAGSGLFVALVLFGAMLLLSRQTEFMTVEKPFVVEKQIVVKEPQIVERDVVVKEPIVVVKEVVVKEPQIVERVVFKDRIVVHTPQTSEPDKALSEVVKGFLDRGEVQPEKLDDFEFIVFQEIPFGPLDGYEKVMIGSQFSSPNTPAFRQWCYISKTLDDNDAAGPRITLAEMNDGVRHDLPLAQDLVAQSQASAETLIAAQQACVFSHSTDG